MLPLLDVLNISCPLHPETKGMVNAKFIAKCKRGVFIVNTARGGLCDENAVAEACKTAVTWPGNMRVAVNVSAVQLQNA